MMPKWRHGFPTRRVRIKSACPDETAETKNSRSERWGVFLARLSLAQSFVVPLPVLFVLLLPGTLPASEPVAGFRPPRLIVLVVIDQFRADYLVRFRQEFGREGFHRLMREGAQFTACFFPYAKTVTAPGHATLATGTTPDRHGVVNNVWYDLDKGRAVEAVGDEAHPLVGATGSTAGVSPRNLNGTTWTDELRLATDGKAKVAGVSIKDRAVVFSLGQAPSAAYWYHTQSGTFVTSRHYAEALPDWVVAFNRERAAAHYYGKIWRNDKRVFLSLTTPSGAPTAQFNQELSRTPYGNQLVVDFARELMAREGLGADEVTDVLFIGFSSNDLAGHRWGPYSDEIRDITLATDRQLGVLLRFLDQKIGREHYWFLLSSDHGVAPTLAQAKARGLPARSVARRDLHRVIEEAMGARWGEDSWLVPYQEIIFNRETLRKHGIGVREAAHLAGGALLGVEGVLGYVAGEETRLDPGLTQAVQLSSYRGRVPDVQVMLEPFALLDQASGGTSHGTPHSYDTHVPLILLGGPFRPGIYKTRASPADLAPTLATLLGITPPSLANGRVLKEALRPVPGSHPPPSPEATKP
jgi:predicted AlkP superfamily pyrophosphatase or phosphodiesterase